VVETSDSAGKVQKRQFLVHIDADLIRRTKILALQQNVTASSLVQIAVAEFLSRRELPPEGDRNPKKYQLT
jgi:predicted transcriptional regulator